LPKADGGWGRKDSRKVKEPIKSSAEPPVGGNDNVSPYMEESAPVEAARDRGFFYGEVLRGGQVDAFTGGEG